VRRLLGALLLACVATAATTTARIVRCMMVSRCSRFRRRESLRGDCKRGSPNRQIGPGVLRWMNPPSQRSSPELRRSLPGTACSHAYDPGVTFKHGTILVKPVLFCAPVFWTTEFWSPPTHAWDWVAPETPLAEKPWVELEVSLDVKLGEVFEAACDAWGITAGPDLVRYEGTRSQQFQHFAFVRSEEDAQGLDATTGSRWPTALPVARQSGSVEVVPALGVSYRELLASSALELIRGDVKRPYVHPVMPQGEPGQALEVLRVTADAIKAAYAGVDDAVGYAEHTIRLVRASFPEMHRKADAVVDEGIRIGAVLGFAEWLRRKRRRRRSRPDH